MTLELSRTKRRHCLFYLRRYFSAKWTLLPESLTGAFSSNSCLDVSGVKAKSIRALSRYFFIRTSTRSTNQSNRRVKCMVAVWAAGLEPPPSLSCSLSHLTRVILVDIFRRVTFIKTEWACWKLDYLTLLLLVTSIYPSNVVSWFSQIRSTWTFQYFVPQQTELTQAPLRQLEEI